MNYCPHCGDKLPQDEIKRPLQPGLPIPPADTLSPVQPRRWRWPTDLPPPQHFLTTPFDAHWGGTYS